MKVGREGGFEAEVADGCGLEGKELLFDGGEGGHEVSVPKAGCEREGADGMARIWIAARTGPHPRPLSRLLRRGRGEMASGDG